MVFDEFITVSLIVGVVVALAMTELLGVAPGGFVVIGFLAPQLSRPLSLVGTLITALVTFALVHTGSRYLLVYGRRRWVMMLLVAVLLDALLGNLVGHRFEAASLGFASIGRIVPGLLANAFDGQGVVRTLGAMALGLSITALVLVVIAGVLPIPIGRNVF